MNRYSSSFVSEISIYILAIYIEILFSCQETVQSYIYYLFLTNVAII